MSVGAEEILEEVGVGVGQTLGRFRFDDIKKKKALWAGGSLEQMCKGGAQDAGWLRRHLTPSTDGVTGQRGRKHLSSWHSSLALGGRRAAWQEFGLRYSSHGLRR